MKKSLIAKIVSIIFMVILIGGCIALFFLPQLYNIFKIDGGVNFFDQALVYQLALYTCYIVCLVIVYKLTILFNAVYSDTPFKKEIELLLKTCAVLFMILALVVFIKAIFIPTLLSFVVALICFIASLSFYVLAEVIKAAIIYKEEIDYTV